MDTTKEPPSILSICTGMRGLERGIERAIGPVGVGAYVEIEAFINYNLVAQMEQGVVAPAPIWTDVKTFPAELFRNKIHGIVGGYPCQGESSAGLRKLERDPRYLWPYVRTVVRAIRPFWCFFENVEGHITGTFKYVLNDLRELGYDVEAGVFTAAEVGASHIRKRIFILAVDNANHNPGGETQPTVNAEQDTTEAGLREIIGLPRVISRTTELEHSKSRGARRLQNENSQGQGHGAPGGGGILYNMANSDGVNKGLPEPPKRNENIETTGGSEEMANTSGSRGGKGGSARGEDGRGIEQPPRIEKWPAPPGPYQHEWEEPRAVESGLGITINGYNFKTDLLRMYGNGVVEQQAELAMRTLIQKHEENYQRQYA